MVYPVLVRIGLECLAACWVACLLATIGCTYILVVRQRRVRASRSGRTFEDFARSFGGSGCPIPILRSVYCILSRDLPLAAGLPADADDRLDGLYAVTANGGTSPDEIIGWALRDAGYEPADVVLMESVTTVRDLVVAASRIARIQDEARDRTLHPLYRRAAA